MPERGAARQRITQERMKGLLPKIQQLTSEMTQETKRPQCAWRPKTDVD